MIVRYRATKTSSYISSVFQLLTDEDGIIRYHEGFSVVPFDGVCHSCAISSGDFVHEKHLSFRYCQFSHIQIPISASCLGACHDLAVTFCKVMFEINGMNIYTLKTKTKMLSDKT